VHVLAEIHNFLWCALYVDSGCLWVIWKVSDDDLSLKGLIKRQAGNFTSLVAVSVFHCSSDSLAIQVIVVLHQELYQSSFDWRTLRLVDGLVWACFESDISKGNNCFSDLICGCLSYLTAQVSHYGSKEIVTLISCLIQRSISNL